MIIEAFLDQGLLSCRQSLFDEFGYVELVSIGFDLGFLSFVLVALDDLGLIDRQADRRAEARRVLLLVDGRLAACRLLSFDRVGKLRLVNCGATIIILWLMNGCL